MTYTAIFFATSIAFWLIYWAITKIKLLSLSGVNKELIEQLEVYRVINDALKVKLNKKKELLEIQDKLINQLQEENIILKTK